MDRRMLTSKEAGQDAFVPIRMGGWPWEADEMTADQTDGRLLDSRRMVRRRKLFGLVFMAPPVAIFALFAVAEGIGLEPGWWGHVLQLGIAAALVWLAWVRPRVGGPLLIVAGVLLTAVLSLQTDVGGVGAFRVIMVFLPLVVAGVFFTLAGNVATEPESDGES